MRKQETPFVIVSDDFTRSDGGKVTVVAKKRYRVKRSEAPSTTK